MLPSFSWLGNGWLGAPQLAMLFSGLMHTLLLSLAVLAIALPAGITLGVIQYCRWPGFRAFHVLVSSVRNTPLLVQILIWYFGVGNLLPESLSLWLNMPHVLWQTPLFSIGWPSFEWISGLMAIALYASAFIAQDTCSGFATVPRGQWEAAQSQGMRPLAVLRWVILPQALHAARPALVGQALNTIKNTSLCMAIGVMELSYRARQVEAETLLTFQAFAVATIGYVLIILLIQRREPALGRR